MKRRLVAAAITLLLFSCLAVLGAYNIHQLLSRQLSFSWRISVCALGAIQVPAVRRWFGLMECCAGLLIYWIAYSRDYIKFRSKMDHICLDIYTPRAEGQGQYGTARWLTERDKGRAFTAVHVDRGAPMLRELIAHGKDDLEDCL